MNKLLDKILDEQKMPYENMSLEERNWYLNILKHCKDIEDTDHKVNGVSICQIVELHFKKVADKVVINGFLSVGPDALRENRCIDGLIFAENNRIIVDYHITRLYAQNNPIEYTVVDEFKLIDDKLIRSSSYNYNMKNIETEINDEIMKGRLK